MLESDKNRISRGESNMKSEIKFRLLALGALAGLQLIAIVAQAHECYRRCHYTPSGVRVCRTVCHGHGHHPGHPGHGHGDEDLAAASSLTALLFSTSAIDNLDDKQLLVVQATEDAAHYLETGRKTGLLPSLLQLSREDAAKRAGVELAAELTDEELVQGILESAEKVFDQKLLEKKQK